MKNLKKVLALVLAFACAFTMFAGAAFTDSADISQTEAVDMLTALGVIKGYEDGSFQPDATVTRAEMAKMIYVIRNGGSDEVSQYEGYKTPFTDVENVNHWAKGYIAYCYANGIIAGKSATKFDPDATVTGQEAAKMALVLLGYDPAKANLVGSAWGTNTINLATKKDLFANYGISITGGCDRQFAAQLLYNTLWACTVQWSSDSESYEDVVVYQDTGDGTTAKLLNVTVAKKYMGLEEATGIYQGDNKINTGLKATESKVGGKTITFVPAEGNDLVGESVKVLYKESKDGVAGLDNKDTIYGVTLSGDTTTVKATLGNVGDNDGNKIKVDGTKYDVYSTGMDVVVNYDVDRATTMAAAAFSNKVTGYQKDSADTVKFVLNDNGKVVSAYITHVDFRKVTGLTSSKITLAGIGALDIDDSMTLDSNVAKNDIVAVTSLYDTDPTSDDTYVTITKAEVASGVKVTDMKSGTEVKIDGNFAKQAAYNNSITAYDANYVASAVLDSTYDFVMYNGYWVAAKKVSASSKDIALVTKTAQGINDQVKVMKSDGTEATYNIDTDDGAASSYAQLSAGGAAKLYSFSLVGDNGIQLKNTTLSQTVTGLRFHNTASDTADYNKDNKTVTIKNGGSTTGTYVTADEAVAYIFVTGDDNYAYQIDSLKTFTSATDVEYVLNDDNEIVAFYGELATKPGATASNDEYGYVVDDVRTTSIDGTKYWEISVWNGTETINIRVEGSVVKTGVDKGAFIKYALTGEGVAESSDIKVLSEGNKGIVGTYRADRKLMTLIDADGNTLNTYAVAKDVKIIGVDTADRELVEGIGDPISSIKNETTNKYPANILYVLNGDNEVVAIFVDVENVLTETDYDIPTDGTVGGPVDQD